MEALAIARAIHVLAILHWFGGVAFVTTVVLPSITSMQEPAARLAAFEAIEGRFSAQVKVSVPLVGLTGAHLAQRLDLWDRFVQPQGWWLAAMAFLWLVFMAILFVVEPLLLRDWLRQQAKADSAGTFRVIQRAHWGLLILGIVTATSAVLGAHGLFG
jgi:uncharacterized membrane protein